MTKMREMSLQEEKKDLKSLKMAVNKLLFPWSIVITEGDDKHDNKLKKKKNENKQNNIIKQS